jgi:aromatic-L-amino-acid/L-tryptophan decarboxylase
MRLNASRRSSPRCTSAQPASTGAPSHLLELAAAPETSIVAFRARPAGCPPSRLDGVNRAVPEAVQTRGRAFVTGTVFGGRETLRACILHPDTGPKHLAILVTEVVEAARALAANLR